MSRLVCMRCGYDMGPYAEDSAEITKCARCGSHDITRLIVLSDKITFHENLKGKSDKMPGKKKRV